jgi:hypothetical protein
VIKTEVQFMLLTTGRATMKYRAIVLLILIFSCSQKPTKGLTIVIVDSASLNDTLKIFVYAKADLLHESTERYLAICREVCDITQEEKTVGFIPAYCRIDSVVENRIYLASQFNVKNDKTTEFSFWINYSGNESGPAREELRKYVSLDTCENR